MEPKEYRHQYYLTHKDKWKLHYSQLKRWYATLDGTFEVLVSAAKQRSRKKKLPFNLTIGSLKHVWEQQKGFCALSGKEMTWIKGKGRGNKSPWNVSIDRIIPGNGYVQNNIRLVCVWANMMKHERSDDELQDMCHCILQKIVV